MKVIPIALAAHMALPTPKLAVWLTVTRTDGVILRATNYVRDLKIGGETYYAALGGTASDVATSASLNADNSELTGTFGLGSISEAEFRAGRYDGATYSRGMVNYQNPSMGVYHQQDGPLGNITLDRSTFIVELRGLMQYLQQSFGLMYGSTCPYILGDSRCTKDLTSFTFTGTLDSVHGMTLFDAARTEAGPSGGIAITAITNANPCVITTATPLGLPTGSAALLSGIVDPAAVNGTVIMRAVSGSTFAIDLDTTNTGIYPPYSGSGGLVTPMGADSGYFDFGLITITSTGDNHNVTRAIKTYIEGQITLLDPFPFALTGSETYRIVAGCDKTFTTCRVKFSNGNNHGGYPYIPGQDKRMQVGHSQ